jgi:hypothetical protein
MVKQPTRAGFGSMLIDRSLRAELDADNRRDFHPDGLRCFL